MSSAHKHDITLLGIGGVHGPITLQVTAEHDPQNPHSIIPRRLVDALGAKIEPLSPANPTMRDRDRVLYVALGTATLKWFTNDKPLTTKFYIVNTLAPRYTDAKIDIIIGGAESASGVMANLLDPCGFVRPILVVKQPKERKQERERKQEEKRREVEREIEDQEAAEKRQREVERQNRLLMHRQQERQQGGPS